MLTSLELNGFKSFADRTRFEFPSGITAVVGPNGSGKSNVVDAVKWVLGAQSVKSLRGKEMTDVIFSGAGNRGAANAAEATLSFDNSAGRLELEADEIHVTRRVYRSGEGEYLLNHQPCRLRDIRDLFAGTGVGDGSYSIIEQGKVDALLQSSPRERRLIFEEAAGVRRFKIKRQEAARRLERVEQNLLRLSDIVDELDSRLRGVRSQAGKARKYKEDSDRLRELRSQVGLVDWRTLTDSIEQLENKTRSLQSTCDESESLITSGDEQLATQEQQADQLQTQMRAADSESAEIRERIAQCESLRRSQLARSDELRQESDRLQRQLLTMTSRVGDAQQLVAETSADSEAAERQFAHLTSQSESQQAELQQAQRDLSAIRTETDQARAEHAKLFKQTTHLEHQIQLLRSQHETAAAASERLQQEVLNLEESLSQLTDQLSHCEANQRQQAQLVEQTASRLESEQTGLRQNRTKLAEAQRQEADLRGRLSGARERAIVLEELERRLDGLSAGTKEVLRLAREQPDGPFGQVRGVVADLLHVDADTAPLVEIALGERANHLVIHHAEEMLEKTLDTDWAGRTSFLRLDVPAPASAVDRIDLSGEAGVMGRADHFVETTADLGTLSRRLLGRYWFVDSLATAVRLGNGSGRGLSFVTVVGEVVGADGTLVVGPQQSATGLLSRRSELRALVDETAEMENDIVRHETLCDQLTSAIEAGEQQVEQLTTQNATHNESLGEFRLQKRSVTQRLEQIQQQYSSATGDHAANQEQAASTGSQLESLREELTTCQSTLARLEQIQGRAADEIPRQEQLVAALQAKVTDDRVNLARSEQRCDGLRRQMEQLQRDHEERDRALADTRERVTECQTQRTSLEQSVLEINTELAELYRSKETLMTDSQRFSEQLAQLRATRTEIARSVEKHRERFTKQKQELQRIELEKQQQLHQRDGLASRMLDDYQIDLTQLAAADRSDKSSLAQTDITDREAVDDEISSLRQRLQALGPVNLEALSELEALEERHGSLDRQCQDLHDARERLEQLVTRINSDSRELFSQTLQIIREHFQELFRSLFGGGEADIVIEEGESTDVLECGIEIMARPPGKQPRNISLLSGGERTMTCVALLLAIFRSRPSPFCVLDEVDAALDEANIERFVGVLKEFMNTTQFIVITHSKRTMACADTLYGVTMQESGVSKRVSVKFSDVTAEGHIRPSAGNAQAA